MFRNRTDAGHELADLLDQHDAEADIVLGIPRGALPVARPVADALNVPLDIVVASKIGAPNNSELAIGAAASDGSVWLNDDVIEELTIPEEYIEHERDRETENAREKVERYRESQEAPNLTDKRVVIVDDGIATGATAKACLKQVHEAGAEQIILAVPIGPPDAIDDLEDDADDVLAVQSPSHFTAVGQAYERFEQVSDQEATTYLDTE